MKGSVRKRGEKWSYYFTYKQDGKYKKKEKGHKIMEVDIIKLLEDVEKILRNQAFTKE